MFRWEKIRKPVFCLAPMAEITTLPFRSICKSMGADIVFTPMISSDAVVFNPEKTLKIAEFLTKEQPVIVQIFGYDGEKIAQAANIVDKKLKPAGIDINMGCPAPNITGNECGSGLLRDLDKALDLVKIVRKMYKGQLSVKLRLGWREYNIKEFCQQLEKIGVDALIIHGRTAKQKYTGHANWQPIYDVAQSIQIPVIGNGDIMDWRMAYRLLAPSIFEGLHIVYRQNDKPLAIGDKQLAGVMIGRGALGNPFIFKEIKGKRTYTNKFKELPKIIHEQTLKYIEYTGNEKRAILEMRKHLGWYIKGFAGAQEIRKKAMLVNNYQDVKMILKELENNGKS
ncbi:hypothetical protein A3F08_02770 [Candidatus Berkelbacteria bacterium RIFCSPHIGHO2_12_FULL_36_9]|uniref:tRNA-dihydrouridine synthase n=1 Tax=Candidatus Berkelbacteria bacterium RIFCSPHIGHO2_12_FULL_36_9 TaxID=1797469 RepID=A0A1F5EEB9_9BACT|nr:MAG: hypothetical protein A3F08_02770 [Candidatus Berkelbacteria bacterium RIFCSPHIGHO2_12_FULL_36_9]